MPDLRHGQAATIAAVVAVVVAVRTPLGSLRQCALDIVGDRIAGRGDPTCTYSGREIGITTSRSS